MNALFTDIHHHILYGLDDGPASALRMQRMLDAAAADGTGHIIATPHVSPGILPFHQEAYDRKLEEANAYCCRKGYSLRVLPGAEILFTQAAVRMLSEGKIPTLCGTRFVLVEWCSEEDEETVSASVRRLASAGFIPVMAHVDRLRCYQRRPEQLLELCNTNNIRLQVNCGAVLKHPLSPRHRLFRRLCKEGMLDYIASDAHNISDRPSRMSIAHEKITALYGKAYADRLMRSNPMEIYCTPED